MQKKFSRTWIRSIQPRKQRKYRHHAPLHVKQSFLGCHLSKDLIQKYGKRSVRIVKGDKIKILRGQFKGKDGKVERVSLKMTKVFVTGIDRTKKAGSKSMHALDPSNLTITELNLDDKKRKAAIERKGAKSESMSKKESELSEEE